MAQSVQEEILEMIEHEDMEVQCEVSPCCSEAAAVAPRKKGPPEGMPKGPPQGKLPKAKKQREGKLADPSSYNAEELEQYFSKLFSIADENSDGVLQPDELKKMLGLCGFNLSAEEIAQFVDEADTNHDGVIEYDEFLPVAIKMLQSTSPKKKKVNKKHRSFAADDLNRVELAMLVESINEIPAAAEVLGACSAADLRLLSPEDVYNVAAHLETKLAQKLILALDLSWVTFMSNFWEGGAVISSPAAAAEAQPNYYKTVPSPLKSEDIPFGKGVGLWTEQHHANVETLFELIDVPQSTDKGYGRIEPIDLLTWINKVDDVFSPSEVAIAVDDAIDLAGTVCLKLDGFKASIAAGLSKSKLTLSKIVRVGLDEM